MAKPKAVIADDSRESPVFWQRMFQASDKRRNKMNQNFAMFARWYSGDLSDLVDPSLKDSADYRWNQSLDNMISLATTASMADLMLHYPRFTVKTPYVPAPSPMVMPGMLPPPKPPEERIFSPALARCEQAYLNITAQRV